MKWRHVSLVSASLALVALGCGSSPEPVYYAMAPVHGTIHQPGWAHMIKLRRPALAGYLDRAEIVSRVVDYRLRVTSGESWSEPLGDMVARLLGEDLAERLPGSIVFAESSPISSDPDAVVSVDIQRFDVGDDGQLALLAEITVEKPPDHTLLGSRRVELHMRPPASGTEGLVGAMSTLLGKLADDMSDYLRSAPPVAEASR
jgi:uncharacterized lipoprotein YmbA